MPVRIALDYRPALLGHAGIGRAVRELARALAVEPGIEVHLFAHSWARAARPAEVPQGAVLHRRRIPGRALPWLARCGLGADRLAGDAAVFHWLDYLHPRTSRARCVLTVHDLAFLREPQWHGDDAAVLAERTRRAAAAAAAVIVPSRTTAADVAQHLPGVRPVVIPFGADHVPLARAAHPFGGAPFALCLGTIEPRKNHRTLMAAWRLLPAPQPQLVVLGRRGWQDEETVAQLLTAQQEGWLRWHSAATDAEVYALLQHAQALVYPSLWEGFGFPPLEAMALGVPVVAHDDAPMRELTQGAALLADAREPAALAAAIDRALHDDAERQRCMRAGRARAAAFRWADCARAHAAVYREVAR